MIRQETLPNGLIHTWSDLHKRIRQETGIVYDDAIDIVEHTYTETDEDIVENEISDAEALQVITQGL